MQTMIPLAQQGIASPQDIQMVLNKIMEISGAGISPLSLSKSNVQAQQGGMMQQPLPAQPMAQ